MKNSIEGRTAIISGAGSGVGRSVAIHLANLNVNLILIGRNEDKLLATKKLCNSNVNIDIYTCDVSREDEVKSLADKIEKLDFLFNNAALAFKGSIEETSPEIFTKLYETNVLGPFMLSKYLLEQLKSSDCATIINMGSVVSNFGYRNESAYAASKHALLGLSKVMAKEYNEYDIRVHILCPGGIKTDMVKSMGAGLENDERVILPEDIADVIEFLLTHHDHAVIDQVNIHRSSKEPFQ